MRKKIRIKTIRPGRLRLPALHQEQNEVDLVLDTIGGEVLQRSLNVVKRGGTLVSVLEEPPQEVARERGIRAMNNSVVLPFSSTELLQTIARLMKAGDVKTVVSRTFLLHEVQQAHHLSQTGHGRGRIVLLIADWYNVTPVDPRLTARPS